MPWISFLLICAAIGIFAGTLSGLLGVGGGVILVPAFMRFLGMPIHQAVATSLCVIIATAIAGSWKHYQLGHLQSESWKIILIVSTLSIVGGYFGAALTGRLSDRSLRLIFAVFLLIVASQMIVQAVWSSNAAPRTATPAISSAAPNDVRDNAPKL